MLSKLTILKFLSLVLTLITFIACSKKNELEVKTADFSVNKERSYLLETVNFVAKDSLGFNEYLWDFGDGSALKGKYYVNHKYEKGGDYIVSLTINGLTSSKEIKVFKGSLSFKILNKSSKIIGFLTYIDNYETGSVSRFDVGFNSQSDTIYGSDPELGNHHIFGISLFIENAEYTTLDLTWVDDFQHYDFVMTDSTKLIPRSSHGNLSVVLIKDL